MNMIRLSLRMLLRDWRAGELHILTLALIIAVSSVATVSFFFRSGTESTGAGK